MDNEGTVEFCKNGAWSSLCSEQWGYLEAFVVCRQLGLPATGKNKSCCQSEFRKILFFLHVSCLSCSNCSKLFIDVHWYTNARFGIGHGTPTLTKWKCFGNESSLAHCLHGIASDCYHSQDVGISCYGEEVKGYLNSSHTRR